MGVYTGAGPTVSPTVGAGISATTFGQPAYDELVALAAPGTTYTPALTGFTLGNGSITGRYTQVGKFVCFSATFIFGSTSAAASAVPTLTLPVAAVFAGLGVFTAQFVDASPANTYSAVVTQSVASTVGLYIPGTSGLYTTPSTTTPFTWTTGDYMHVGGLYEAV